MNTPPTMSGKKRVLCGACILIALAIGLYASWPTICHDWPRMFLWQQILFWVADIAAVLCVLKWMFFRPTQTPGRRNSNGRWIAFMMLISFLVDATVTGAGLHSTTLGMRRALETEASVVNTSEKIHGDMRHIRLQVRYTDQANQNHLANLSFVEVAGRPVHPWEKESLNVATGKAQNATIGVIYDPQLPVRVWFKGQSPGSVSSISVNFMVIHIGQAIFMFWLCTGIITNDVQVDPRNYLIHLVPIIIEAGLLTFIGFLTWAP